MLPFAANALPPLATLRVDCNAEYGDDLLLSAALSQLKSAEESQLDFIVKIIPRLQQVVLFTMEQQDSCKCRISISTSTS